MVLAFMIVLEMPNIAQLMHKFPRFQSIFGIFQRAWWKPSSWGCVNITLWGGVGVRRGLGDEGWKGGFQDLIMKLLRLGLALLESSRLLAAAILLRLCADVKDSTI